MLGLIGTVGGAVALEVRRIRRRGGPDEVKEIKQREKELRDLLEATNQELAKAQKLNEAADRKAQQLEQEKDGLRQEAAELGKQKEQLQQNNSKLVLTNIMLLNKAKHLEDSSRALVAKQEDLQHQLEQLQRERQAELAASEATLAMLKDQVTAVLNRYLSKDIELQVALQEMQALGIELVPLGAQDGRSEDVVEFEPKFVLDSPHRMQRLMNAAVGRVLHLPGHDEQDTPMLTFPMGIGKDPSTGMPRVALGWRQGLQGAPGSITGLSDSELKVADQQAGSSSAPTLSLLDQASSDSHEAATSSTVPHVTADTSAEQTLTFTSGNKKQATGSGFSLGFGSIGRISMRSSSDGGRNKGAKATAATNKPPVVPSSLLKAENIEDDLPAFTSSALTTR